MTWLLIAIGIIALPVIYNLLFPLKPPVLENYFQPGEVFQSKWEGVTQNIVRQVGDKVYSRVVLEPGAAGPPEHLHIGFDETAVVTRGHLTVKVDGKTKILGPGDRLYFPKGIYHQFANKTNEIVEISSGKEEDFIPVGFAYALSKFYQLFDTNSKLKMIHFFFKMSIFDKLFDSYVKQAPVNGQKIIKKILKPYARVLGYTLYDKRSRPPKYS